MTDSKYFTSSTAARKGEIHELQEELSSTKEDKRKEAVKKVIAAMTVGKDMSALFTDVLNCIQTNNLELKKLVYLYVINHAKMQPDRAILAVNTFQRDASDPNPLVRALAIRTMGCIRVDKVTEYLCEPLRNCLRDRDPYVRKTAALCVAKLYDMNPDLVENQGFLDLLTQLLSDSNPTVVANAVAALSEIEDLSDKSVLNINSSTLSKLLAALNECTEWGQVFILGSLAKYKPVDMKEAEGICERVSPRLNHANSAVVLAAVRVLMLYMDILTNQETVKLLCKKMAPPLVTLLTTKEPEIQYVALRNINLIVQKKPSILAHEMRVFFIKYNDPIYVKMEKLEIMIMLAAEKNIEQVLNECKEAASDVDVEFVRKAVRAIGRCAIKIEKAAERCIQVLLDLIQTKVNYVVQEAIVVIKDIFRKYPNRYESIIATLCQNLDTLDEPEAKASMIWIIGEYAERIENADELLSSFLENFADETTQVQLQLVTAIVKLFLKRPKNTQEMVQKVLNLATQESDNPDLRDRGYVYWRLLSTDPKAAQSVVLGEKPLISDSSIKLDETLLQELIGNISLLSSVYQKLPETFVTKLKEVRKERKPKKEKRNTESLLPQEDEDANGSLSSSSSSGSIRNPSSNVLDLDLGRSVQPAKPTSILDDLDFLNQPSSNANTSQSVSKEIILSVERGGGMQVAAAFIRRDAQLWFDATFTNQTSVALNGFALQFNKNTFGLAPGQPQISSIFPGQSVDISLPITVHPTMLNMGTGAPASNIVQIAVKNNVGTFYMQATVPLHVLFSESGQISREEYVPFWKSISDENLQDISVIATREPDAIQGKLQKFNVFYVARRTVPGQPDVLYFSSKIGEDVLLLELSISASVCRSCVKCGNVLLVPLFQQWLASVLAK